MKVVRWKKIPPMTDRLGRYWDAPKPEAITLFADHVEMSEQTFKALPEYSTSVPSGTYAGKMWKRTMLQPNPRVIGGLIPRDPPVWYLCFYYDLPNDTKTIGIASLRISIVNKEQAHEEERRVS